MSKEKEPGGLFFRSDTPRIGRNEESAMPSAHFDHVFGRARGVQITSLRPKGLLRQSFFLCAAIEKAVGRNAHRLYRGMLIIS